MDDEENYRRTSEVMLAVQEDEWRALVGKTIQHVSSATDGNEDTWLTLHFTDGTTLSVGHEFDDLYWDGGDGRQSVWPQYEEDPYDHDDEDFTDA